MDAIRTDGLSKHFTGGFWRPRPAVALERLDLTVAAGEVFGFLGPNGAGKTTTLKLLMRLIFPTSGTAEILGRPAGDSDVRRRIGYLPENPTFYDNVSAEELLTYFASLFGYRGAERASRVDRLLALVGLGGERRLRLRNVSKGTLQRVGMAQALVNDPDVVFLDEPMSGLDPLGRRDVLSLMASLRECGTTVFFSSHILADAEAICTSVGIVNRGRLVASGRVRDLVSAQTRGWQAIVSRLADGARDALVAEGAGVRPAGPERHAILLPAAASPEAALARLQAAGATVISLAAVRESLEDVFLASVRSDGGSRD